MTETHSWTAARLRRCYTARVIMTDLRRHRRINDTVLGPLERPALTWLAACMPARVTPDVCTGVGVAGAVVVALGYALSGRAAGFLGLASLGLVINWLGDSLDGTLARHRHVERPVYGFFLDHTTDAFNESLMFLALGLTPYVRLDMAALLLCGYLLVSVLVFVRTCALGQFQISYGKLGPTEFRVMAMLFNTAMYLGGPRSFAVSLGSVGPFVLSPYDLVAGGVALALLIVFVTTAVRDLGRLSRVDG